MTLPLGWAEATLGEVCDILRGVTYNKTDARSTPGAGLVPIARATNIQLGHLNSHELVYVPETCVNRDQYLREGDMVIATSSGSKSVVGKAARAGSRHSDMAFGAFCGVVRPADADIGDWIVRVFKAPEYRSFVESVAMGTNINNLRFRDIQGYGFPVPPADEQRRIVAKLDALTARLSRARAELERVPDLSERQHLSILRAGMRGELTTDWRTNNSPESVESQLARFPTPQQGRGGRGATDKVITGIAGLSVNDPGIDLPDGWAWVPLLHIAKQETGHTPSRSKPNYWDGGVPWIGIRDAGAHHGKTIADTAQTISEAGLANSSARLLPAGTVCLSRTASVGYVTIMARSMATSQDFATWTCTETLLPEYLMYALMAEGDEIRNFGKGTTHTTIYFPEVRAFHIALPPMEEQKEIVACIKAAIARAERLAAEAARAQALLDRLESAFLAKAFRGDLLPQDQNDEPAQALLDRIRTKRAAAPQATRGRRTKSLA